MLIALFLASLSSLYASPAKAGAQDRAARDWAPAFAGEAFLFAREADENGPGGTLPPTRAGGTSPIDAERAFAEDARTLGQWTAFRKWSTDDAVMFVPQPVDAHAFLKDRKESPKAIDWWPTESYISCDGSLAVNTGGWKRPDGSVGYFTTVWAKQPDGHWKWIIDHGDQLTTPREKPGKPKLRKASCSGVPRDIGNEAPDPDQKEGGGVSKDRTLHWYWTSWPDGSRLVGAQIWNGWRNERVLVDSVVAPPK